MDIRLFRCFIFIILFIHADGECQTTVTPDDAYNYLYVWPDIPVGATTFTFNVRAATDVHIALSPIHGDAQNMYEIVLGGWGNQNSAIRLCKGCEVQTYIHTPAILSATEYREFRVSFENDLVEVSRFGEAPFLRFQNTDSIDIKYVGISTGFGSEGSWKFCGDWNFEPDCQTTITPIAYNYQYVWPDIPVGATGFRFNVCATNDVHIALSPIHGDAPSMYEITIGGWGNNNSAIRLCKGCDIKTYIDTPAILSATEYREFRVSFENDLVEVSRVSETAFMRFKNTDSIDVKNVGISTGFGSEGSWKFCGDWNFEPDCQTTATPDANSYQYVWPAIPVGATGFSFSVRATNNVHITLSPIHGDAQSMYEIVIGGWGNQNSAIGLCKGCEVQTYIHTPGILSATEYREFRVSFDNDLVEVSRVGEAPFMSFKNRNTIDVKYVGILTGFGSDGSWNFCGDWSFETGAEGEEEDGSGLTRKEIILYIVVPIIVAVVGVIGGAVAIYCCG
ncbi:uncharacterized protein [Amphiura filiformis]|uniref:uncharacterized protein isoform X1 n=1 Tax=Amphiura filiformis TaxID=82378 RepID=UPI003B20FCCC